MKRFPYYFLFLLALTASHFALGAETVVNTYTPLVGVPGIETNKAIPIEEYVKVLYYLSITVAGLLAVVQIIYGGVEWTFSGSGFSEIQSAKTRIYGALIGLLIILSAVLILNTINTNLTVLNIFGNAPSLNPTVEEVQNGLINDNPIVTSIFGGEFGSKEHLAFMAKCRKAGFKPLQSKTNPKIIECRGK